MNEKTLIKYALNGINALASVVEKDKNNWFLGHIGASIIASTLLIKHQYLDKAINLKILDRIDWELETHNSLIKDFDNEELTSDISPILNAIEQQKNHLCASGHGIIYGALFLDVVDTFDLIKTKKISKKVIENIAKLIENNLKDNPARYYSVDDYREIKAPTQAIENWDEFFVDVIDRSTKDVYQDDGTFFLTGEKLHGITHAHAIFTLRRLGYTTLSQSLGLQLLKQLDLTENFPKDTAVKLPKNKFNPNDSKVWNIVEGNDNAHQVKLTHSFLEMAKSLNIEQTKLDAIWYVFKAVQVS